MRTEFVDLRKEIDFFRNRHGFFWVALRSAKLDTTCSCSDSYGISSSKCTMCMGTGHLFVDKLVKATRARYMPGVDILSEIGKVNTSSKTWVVHHNVKPKNTDWILELDLDESTGIPRQPFKVKRAFKLQNTFPARGPKGRIDYWYCFSEERNFEYGRDTTTSPINPPKAT